jgi:hypothetical protein
MNSVGDILRQEREKKGVTLRTIEKEIKVREKVLRELESNNWEAFPSRIYITGIINNYARHLGLDTQRILAIFRRDYERKEDVHFKRSVMARSVTSESKRAIFTVIAGFLLLFSVYFGYQVTQYLTPPKVEIITPLVDRVRSTDHIRIVGKTEKEASITIYGERVYPNREGRFEYLFPVKDGKNELVIEVIGANGKKTTLRKTYIKE